MKRPFTLFAFHPVLGGVVAHVGRLRHAATSASTAAQSQRGAATANRCRR
jgi:hypothetical protein